MADIKDKKEEKKDIKKDKPKAAPLIAGGGLIQILHDSIAGIADLLRGHLDNQPNVEEGDNVEFEEDAEAPELPVGPFEVLSDDDFDSSDPVVESFKNDVGGCGGVVKIIRIDGPGAVEKLSAILDKLKETRTAYRAERLNQVFAHINAAAAGDGARHQVEALKGIDALIRDAHVEERENLLKAREAVLAGTTECFDAAGFRVRQSALGYGSNNVRLAYTTIEQNNGEGYVMLPQGKHQLGYPVAMEVTKFKAQSADAKIDPKTGELTNAAAVFEKIRDNNDSVKARMEVHRHPDNEANLLTLKEGERHKLPTKEERPWEQRLEEDSKGRSKEKDFESSVEKRLDDAKKVDWGHQGEPKDSLQDVLERKASVDRIDADSDKTMGEQLEADHTGWTDETLEELLDDERVGLTEEELDMLLEEWLERDRKKKEKK